MLLTCFFDGGSARGALFQDDALALFGDGVGVAGAVGEAVEDVFLAFFDLAPFVIFFSSGCFSA